MNSSRHNKSVIFILLLLAVVGIAEAQTFQPYKSGVIPCHGYSFPVVPGTDEWKSISHTQRVASLQLPTDTLQSISTARLLETCLYYPFNIDIFALDDQIYSFNRVKEQFNGYSELYQRTDFVQELIDLYASRNVEFVNQIGIDLEQGHYAFDYHILEFMFTDAALLASDTQAAQIAATLYEKKELKTQYSVYGSTNRMVIALAIGRCLQRTNAFSDYQGTTLSAFLQSGKPTNASDLDYIYSKARNQ
ncbi:MAG: hypothetical protein IJ057_05060 [Bacteroidales bacterium]|nr:hypothetical protein [Bacteroidales bacterium]